MVLRHDTLHVEIVSVHAELFQDAGFVRCRAGVVVIFEPLEAVVWPCSSAVGTSEVVSLNMANTKGGLGRGGAKDGDDLPVAVSVEMKGAEVDVL